MSDSERDDGKIRASTVTPEMTEAMRRTMGQLVKGMGDGETWESVFPGGNCRVQKIEGKYHAAISIDEDAVPIEKPEDGMPS